MLLLSFFFFFFISQLPGLHLEAKAIDVKKGSFADSYVDRQCGGDLRNLWLEVVAVVDNSKGMTNQGLSSVAANIASVFSNGTRIGVDPDEPRTTRVGLVTYSSDAQIAADLNAFNSLDDLFDGVFTALSKVSSTEESYLATGLFAAEQVLAQGRQTSNRKQYQQVVIVYASTYKGSGDLNPLPVAERLRAAGVTIITVAYNQGGDDSLLADLGKIATPHDSFSNTDLGGNTLGEVQQALLQANCYCPNGWTQYRLSFSDVFSYRYGVCLQAVGLNAVWRAARLSCRNRWPKSYLVSEFDADKHDFVLNLVSNTTGIAQPYTYHIGLTLVNGKWSWEQAAGETLLPVQNGFQDWNPGYPTVDSTLTAGLNQQSGSDLTTGWQNINQYVTVADYVCQVTSCDTDNFCESDDSVSSEIMNE